VVYTRAGIEIGVASTKAFTSQLVAVTSLPSNSDSRGASSIPRWCARWSRASWSCRSFCRSCCGRARRFERSRSASPTVTIFSIWDVAALPAGPRRRPEAERDLVHPCRRLRGGRDEARTDRPHRLAHASGRHRPERIDYEKTISNLEEIKARDGIVIAVATGATTRSETPRTT